MRVALSLLASTVFIAGAASPAAATTATELLNTYNLIVFGDLTSNSQHVDGRTYVGGNAAGGDYNQKNLAGPTPSLTVGGNLSGNVNLNGPGLALGGSLQTSGFNLNKGGNVYIGGNWGGTNANFNFNGNGNGFVGGVQTGSGNVNGGTMTFGVPAATLAPNLPSAATTGAIQSTLSGYSSWLDTLSANSTIDVASNRATFNAAPDASGRAVFNIANASTFFGTFGEIEFNLNGATQLVINVSGALGNTLDIAENFLGGSAIARSLDTVWNFTDATKINIGAQFGGSILAILADVTLGGNEEGTLVSKSLIQNAEIHYNGSNNLTNPPDEAPPAETPVPGALPLFATGLGALALIARRRRKAVQKIQR